MKKQPEITDKTRQALLDAFCDLYKEKSIDKITIMDITRKAGYNRSTFYHYFQDIYSLLEYLEDDVISRIKKTAIENLSEKSPGSSFVKRVATLYEGEGKYISVLVGSNAESHFAKLLKELMYPMLSKEFNITEVNRETKYLIDFTLSGILSMITLWYKNQDITADELAELILKTLTEGVSSSNNM